MASRDTRKTIYVGKSLAITLPKPYADFYKIKKDEPIVILYNKVLILIPESMYEKTIKASGGAIDQILNPDSSDIILTLQPDLNAWIEEKAKDTQLTREQLTIMLLREMMTEAKKEAR